MLAILVENMSELKRQLEIGAYGWDHEYWTGPFYPEELPPDWRLTYYSNEWRCVLVPESDWFDAPCSVAERWAEDVHAQFSFFLELRVPPADAQMHAAVEKLAQMASVLGERLSGLVLKPGGGDADPCLRFDLLLDLLDPGLTLFVDCPAKAVRWAQCLDGRDISGVWRPDGAARANACQVGIVGQDVSWQ